PPRLLQFADTGSSTRAKTTEYPHISGGDSYFDPPNAVGTASQTISAPKSSKGGSGTYHSSHPLKSSFQRYALSLPSRVRV
ncbi:hypothetical protein TSMEX_002539, partial [Taenia solium]